MELGSVGKRSFWLAGEKFFLGFLLGLGWAKSSVVRLNLSQTHPPWLLLGEIST